MSIQKVSIRQIKAARSLLGWSQDELADASSISIPTIKRLEATDGDLGGRSDTAQKIVAAIEAAGVEFIPENGGGAGVRLRKGKAAGDHPKPTGPASDAVDKMDAAIEEHRSRKR